MRILMLAQVFIFVKRRNVRLLLSVILKLKLRCLVTECSSSIAYNTAGQWVTQLSRWNLGKMREWTGLTDDMYKQLI